MHLNKRPPIGTALRGEVGLLDSVKAAGVCGTTAGISAQSGRQTNAVLSFAMFCPQKQ